MIDLYNLTKLEKEIKILEVDRLRMKEPKLPLEEACDKAGISLQVYMEAKTICPVYYTAQHRQK